MPLRVRAGCVLGLILAMLIPTLGISQTATDEIMPFDGVRRLVLPNGLTVLIDSSSKARTLSLYLGVKSGSSDEPGGPGRGLSHFVEHMLFKGTPKRASGKIENDVRRMGGSMNAYTSYEMTVYYLQALSQFSEEAVDLLADAAFNSLFPPEEITKELQVILGEFSMREDDLDRRAHLALWSLLFRSHPNGVPVIGYRSLFEKVTREELLDYYHRYYVPNNMVLTVVGDADPDALEETVRRAFGAAERGLVQESAKPGEPPQVAPRKVVLHGPSEHARLHLGYVTVPVHHPDAVALDVLSALLGDGKSSRLNQRLKETAGAVLKISSSHAALKENGVFSVSALLLPDKMAAARQGILHELSNLDQNPLLPAELERIKNQVLESFYRSLETHAGLAHDLLTSEIYTGDYAFSERYAREVGRVTPEDIRRVARKYLSEEALCEVQLLPASPPDGSEKMAARAELVSSSEPQRSPIARQVLPNGLKLLIEKDPSFPNFNIQLAFLGGTRVETPETNGVSALTAKLLTKGTAGMNQEEVQRTVELWGGALDSFSGQNSFGLSISGLSRYTPEALKLLSQLIEKPAFPEPEFQKNRLLQLEALHAKKDDVFSQAGQMLKEEIYGDHPYALDPLGNEASLANLKRSHVVDYHKTHADLSRAVLSIFGDIEPKKARELAERFFGAGSDRSPGPAPSIDTKFVEGSRAVTKESPHKQAVVMLAFNGMTIFNERRYAYDIVYAVMDGSAGRLYRSIRHKAGLSYVVGSSLSVALDPGNFFLYAAVEPASTARAMEIFREEVRELRKNGLTPEEIEAAKIQLIGDHERADESKSARILGTTFGELYGIGIEPYLEYSRHIREVRKEDVDAVIRDYLDLNNSIELTVSKK